MKKVMCVFGTRPEAIKICPLVNELKKREGFDVYVCVTAQHRQMLDQVLQTFGVIPDYDLNIMKDRQTLFDITTAVLDGIKHVLEAVRPVSVLQNQSKCMREAALAVNSRRWIKHSVHLFPPSGSSARWEHLASYVSGR